MNITEFKGDNRIKKILPLIYDSVEYKQITISVPIAAKDSGLGLADMDKLVPRKSIESQEALN